MAEPTGLLSESKPAEPAVAATAAARSSPAAGPTWARSTFWFTFWMGVVLVGTKAVHLGWPEFSWDGLKDFFHDMSVISNADIVFALLVGYAAQLALRYTANSPGLERVVWAWLISFCLVCVGYAVVSVQIFDYLRSPLTYPLIYLAGDVKNMRSSVTAFASGRLIVALIGVPLAYLATACATHRFIQPKRTGAFRVSQWLYLVLLVAFVLYGRFNYAGVWSDRNDRRITENPHWTLFTSCVGELFGPRIVQLHEVFPPEDLEDFQTGRERTEQLPPITGFSHRPRNVIVLVMESTATQYLNNYRGPFADVTPRLREEAAHSLIFDNFHCHVGLTANAVVAISLSIYPGMTWREYTLEHPRLPGKTVAEVLQPLGYRTAFIHNGDLGYTNQGEFLHGRGFDVMWDYRNLDGGVPDPNGFSWGVEDRHLVDGIFKWIDQDRDRPFFALCWTIQTHHPYTLPVKDPIDFFHGKVPPGDDYDLDLYLNALHESDKQIGRLLDGLRERGVAEDTLVVIIGDHGEAFGHPHDTFGHGGKLYQENVNVPLVLWNPKMFDGRRSDTVGSQIDLNPTVLHILGIDPPDSWQGRSMFAPDKPPRAYFYAANDDYLLGVREGRWKYIYNATLGRDVLFDLDEDAQEQTNVAKYHPEVCTRLRQRLAAWMQYEEQFLDRLHRAEAR